MLSLSRDSLSVISSYLSPVDCAILRSCCSHLYRNIKDEAIAIRWMYQKAIERYNELPDVEKPKDGICYKRNHATPFGCLQLYWWVVSYRYKLIFDVNYTCSITDRRGSNALDYFYSIYEFNCFWNLRTDKVNSERLMDTVLSDNAPIQVIQSLWEMLDLSDSARDDLLLKYYDNDELFEWMSSSKKRRKRK